jgi:dienelactone hydrolase
MMKTLIPVLLVSVSLYGQTADTLPGTKLWQFPADIVAEQYRELRTYFEREIATAANKRPAASRQRFRELIRATDTMMEPKVQKTAVSDFGPFVASIVEWPILRPGNAPSTIGSAGIIVNEYGVLLMPKAAGKHPALIMVPDADQSAADLAGLTTRLAVEKQRARDAASRGFVVFVPFFTQRRKFSEPWTNDRSWLFRLGYQTGQGLVGAEVQQVSSACQYLLSLPEVDSERIAVSGAGQGGLIAFYAAALDERLRGAVVTDYFDERERAYNEPEDRMVWNLLNEYGDAQIAGLIAPRSLWIEGVRTHPKGQR